MGAIKMGCSFANLKSNLVEIIGTHTLDNKRIVLTEVSNATCMIREILEENGVNDYVVYDSDPYKCNKSFYGKKVLLMDELNYSSNDIILVASHNINMITERMEEIGYTSEQIIDVIKYKELRSSIVERYDKTKVLNLEEVQREELAILKYVKEKCEENKFDFCLVGGTLLGAVRHEGFIPWDDDIDIAMPYNDYIKLLDIIEKEDKYKILNSKKEPLFRYNYSQVVNVDIIRQSLGFPVMDPTGISIDIFPLFSIPDDDEKRKNILEKKKKNKECIRTSCALYNLSQDYINAQNELRESWENVGFFKSKKVLRSSPCFPTAYYDEIMPYEVYCEFDYLKFVDELYPVPKGYDYLLTCQYGDYMKLPPKEKRHPDHNCMYCYK